jgi:hypothetical protein
MDSLENPHPVYPMGEPKQIREERKPSSETEKSVISPETVAQALRQPEESEIEYNPEAIRDVIQNVKLDFHSLEDLFRAGRKLTQMEGELRELGDLNGLSDLKALQITYENKIANLYNLALKDYRNLVEQDIPKFISSLEKKPNWVVRLFQPRSTQIANANNLINNLLDFQEIFNKLASCKDIVLSVDGHERIYEAQLGIIPDIHEHIRLVLEQTSDDVNRVLTEWLTHPTQRAASHGGISNWGNGCYGISVMQALGATQHFATLNSQVNTANPPVTLQDEVQRLVKGIHTKVGRGQPVSNWECFKFFQTIFNSDRQGHFNPNARHHGATREDSLAQHDAANFVEFILECYRYQFATYRHITTANAERDQPPQMETMIRLPLPRQREPLTLKTLMGKRSFEPGVVEEQILTAAPPLLPIQLYRFEFDAAARKVDTPIEIPINEPLYVKTKEGAQIIEKPYSLKSFTTHLGNTPHGGHYITYRRQEDGWICCNDSRVSVVSEEQVKAASRDAYTLFFEKQ